MRTNAGVSLIEVMLALSIFATVLIAMGGLMFQAARHTRQSAIVAYRSAAVTSGAAWAQGLPWDSLPTAAGCVGDTIGGFTYDRCATIQNLSLKLRRVTVVISSTGALVARPETVVVDRNKPRLRSPLNVN